MRILFICGSLEPGKACVGDYTQKLAVELIRQGHLTAVVALNDKYLTQKFIGVQYSEDIELPVLRTPSNWPIRDRIEHVKAWINEFNPELLSLQFVIFTFHPKGLPFNLSNLLLELGGGRKWHIMFHELWVGMAKNDTFKRNVWGKIQKFLINNLIKNLKPELIHTQCDLFLQQLTKEKHQVIKLPLFSNIEVFSTYTKRNNIEKYALENEDPLKFVLFGGLHPEAKFAKLISELKKYKKVYNKSFELLYLGRNGQELGNHLKILGQEKVEYKVFGEMNPQNLSAILSVSSIGISTGSPQMLEKNGTVAAMLAHGLPVICIGRDLLIKNITVRRLSGTYFLDDAAKLFFGRPVIDPPVRLTSVAAQFINDLQLKDKC